MNLKSPRGVEIVRSLLKKADVTVENMAPGTIERLGLGYDAVKEINPGIIYCQVKGFGTGSPYEKSLAFDMIAQAAGGPISVTGEGDRAPVKPGPSFGDAGTGMLMAVSILGALYQRTKTGQGRRLQVAMQDAMTHYMRVPFSRTQQSGQAQLRNGSSRSNPALAPSALYPCKGGGPNDYAYIFTSRANPDHWRRLLKAIEREDLIGDARYDTGPARGQRAAEVDELIAAWTREHSKEEVMKVIGDAGVPAGAVFDTLELMNDPSLAERGIHADDPAPDPGPRSSPSISPAPEAGAAGTGTGARAARGRARAAPRWRAARTLQARAPRFVAVHHRGRRAQPAHRMAGPRPRRHPLLDGGGGIAGQERHLLGHRIARAGLLRQASAAAQQLLHARVDRSKIVPISSSVGGGSA